MPTAAKLVAALSFAFLAFVVGTQIEATMPEDQRVGYLYPVAIAAGAIAGWLISGAAKRASYLEAASTGMRSSVIATAMALFAFSLGTMLHIAMRGRYRGPMDALLDIIDQFFDFGALLLHTPVAVAILLGGALAGMVTETAGRRWR